ncbi:glyceraldehyde-3-phosphate dehydrogenase 1 [Agyrium rufum]|nr:glyceraldehyde-3-phosphate dehydrogenase 1 [Agyrium rufum]
MLQTAPRISRASTSSSSSYVPNMSRQNTMSSHDGRSVRQSKRMSITALYMSMSARDKDLEIEDDLARGEQSISVGGKKFGVIRVHVRSVMGPCLLIDDSDGVAQKILRDLKSRISSQSKKNFVLEKDVRYLDSRIALLIQNRIALEEQNEVASHLEDATDLQEGFFPNDDKTQKYGSLFFLLQSEPRHIAHLCRLVTMAEIDSLLQTVMFTIYGNQYESREEHLLLTMFQSVLTYQFDNTLEYSSLLRANTPVSRMMTTYTRRGPGQTYLKEVLSEKINSLVEMRDVNLEIDPLKVYQSMREHIEMETGSIPDHLPAGITQEEAAANAQVQAIVEPRVKMLTEIASSFLTTIIEAVDKTPYGIRWICKQIRSLSRRKYPDAQDHTICTLIGSFFFLRFINPAIVTPRSYMLVEGPPDDKSKRTLTLIAKILQNLANKPSYSKEQYMEKLQPFVTKNQERVNKFLLDLCEVSDFYESLEMDNYVALSKKDLELSITLNEVYATHALLEKHSQELARDDSSHLKIMLAELGGAPAQLPRKENRAIVLPLFSRWETAMDDITSALDITTQDVLFMEAKASMVQILRSLPATSVAARRPLRLDQAAHAAATLKNDPVMVRKGIRAMDLIGQLQEMGVIDKSDGFSTLRDEVEQELQHLGSLKEKVLEESRKLEEVFRTIKNHNTYLVTQLDTYKSYLHNVRSQSEGTKRKQQKHQRLGPYKFTHQQLEKEGVIQRSNVPENRRSAIYFNFTSPLPGTFVISLHYKGRSRSLLELDLKLDDLLEMQKDNQADLDLEYVQFNVPKVLALLNKRFARKKGWS